MSDFISRQAAIETLLDMNGKHDPDGYVLIYRCDACDNIYNLPSAQPEIIRCKDCKNYTDVFDIGRIFEKGECEKLYLDTVRPDDFCSWAERREE